MSRKIYTETKSRERYFAIKIPEKYYHQELSPKENYEKNFLGKSSRMFKRDPLRIHLPFRQRFYTILNKNEKHKFNKFEVKINLYK